MNFQDQKIAVVIPCYRVRDNVLSVVQSIPSFVWKIYVVDDACPEGTGAYVTGQSGDARLHVLTHTVNEGVGGAVITGYRRAMEDGADIVVKIDGDGQMDPALISQFVRPIAEGKCDYTKGNRFYRVEDVRCMPGVRLFGNAVLSFLTKLSSGYWGLFDPTNGYTAIHAGVLKEIPLEKLAKRYFFESDLLFRLNIIRAVIEDVPMKAVYGDEESNLRIGQIICPFMGGHMRNFFKRIFYNYFLRDFSIASIEIILGAVLFVFGVAFGVTQWAESVATGTQASAGTVMLSALPIILGVQFILSFLQYDIQSVPKNILHNKIV